MELDAVALREAFVAQGARERLLASVRQLVPRPAALGVEDDAARGARVQALARVRVQVRLDAHRSQRDAAYLADVARLVREERRPGMLGVVVLHAGRLRREHLAAVAASGRLPGRPRPFPPQHLGTGRRRYVFSHRFWLH